jgi:hypothetical protein
MASRDRIYRVGGRGFFQPLKMLVTKELYVCIASLHAIAKRRLATMANTTR